MAKNLSERMREANRELLIEKQAPVINPGDQVETRIGSMQSQLAALMPEGGNARQIVADAVQVLRQNPKLRQCDPMSVLGGLCTLAQLNLRPGLGGQAWLIPMQVSKRADSGWVKQWQAQLIIGYQGALELARRSPQLADVQVIRIYENDRFQFSYDYDRLVHEVNWKDPGEVIGWYTVIRLADGIVRVDRPWTVKDMEEHRDKYAMAKKRDGTVVGPWRDNFEAMADKTAVLRALKYAPRSYDLEVGLYADGTTRTDVRETTSVFEAAHEPQLELQPEEAPAVEDAPVDPETGEVADDAAAEE